MIHPVILSGGSGTRLWPMSRTLYPKQLLALVGRDSLLQQTVGGSPRRRLCRARWSPMRSIASSSPSSCARSASRRARCCSSRSAAIPRPAACVAALALAEADPDALMLLMPSDHSDRRSRRLSRGDRRAAAAARAGALVTFGITPERAETGYGYIGAASRSTASTAPSRSPLCREAGPRAGERLCRVRRLFLEQRHLPVPGAALSRRVGTAAAGHAWRRAGRRCNAPRRDSDFVRLDKEAFAACPGEFDRLRGHGAHQARRGGAGPHGLERSRLVGRAVEDGRQGSARQFDRRQCRRRGHPQLLSALRGRAGRRDRHRGPRRRRDRRCGDAGAAQPHAGGQTAGRTSGQGTPRRGRCAADRAPAVGQLYRRCTTAIGCRSSTSWSNRAASCRCRCTITAPSIGSSCRAPPKSAAATRR